MSIIELLWKILRRNRSTLTRLESWPSDHTDTWCEHAVTARMNAVPGSHALFENLGGDGLPGQDPIVREQLEALKRVPYSASSVLDFGCGNGIYSRVLAEAPHTAKWKYHGADINRDLIEKCQEQWPDALFTAIDADGPLPFMDGSFDIVFASGVLFLMRDPLLVLKEFRRISKKWALVSRVPVRKYAHTGIYLQDVRHRWGREVHPMHVFNREDLIDMFREAGFRVDWSDHGVECYRVPGEAEPIHHMLFLLERNDGA